MNKAGVGKGAETRIEYWRARIAEQERSGMSVGRFCQEQQITEQSFYVWRKRLRQPEPVRFALVEPGAAPTETAAEAALELMLKNWRAATHRPRRGRGGTAYRIDRFAGMMHLPGSVRVYLCLTPCDMRKSFDSLHALVREHLELDAFAGHLFVFASRRRDRGKILYWERDGFALWSN